jgi:hypothetical protein
MARPLMATAPIAQQLIVPPPPVPAAFAHPPAPPPPFTTTVIAPEVLPANAPQTNAIASGSNTFVDNFQLTTQQLPQIPPPMSFSQPRPRTAIVDTFALNVDPFEQPIPPLLATSPPPVETSTVQPPPSVFVQPKSVPTTAPTSSTVLNFLPAAVSPGFAQQVPPPSLTSLPPTTLFNLPSPQLLPPPLTTDQRLLFNQIVSTTTTTTSTTRDINNIMGPIGPPVIISDSSSTTTIKSISSNALEVIRGPPSIVPPEGIAERLNMADESTFRQLAVELLHLNNVAVG